MEVNYEDLFNAQKLDVLRTEFGKESEIKMKSDKCQPMLYEIRTALAYWFDGDMSHRTSDAFALRLFHYEHDDELTVEEAMRL